MWKIFLFLAFAVWTANSLTFEDNNPCEIGNMETHFVNDYSCCPCYFTCFQGQPFPLRCPAGFYFDEDTGSCRPIADVECVRCPEGEGIWSFPEDGSCTDYVLCINGQALERSCAIGTRFDPVSGLCVQRELVECEADVSCPATGTEIIPDPNSCEHFIICQEGMKLERRRCAAGLLFDPEEGRCVRAEDFVCEFSAKRQQLLPLLTRSIPKAAVQLN